MRATHPTSLSPLLACAPLAGAALWAGGEAWRLGGGSWVLGLGLGLFGVVMPVALAEGALARGHDEPAPASLARIAGAPGAWVSWLGLSALALLAALGVTLAGWGASQALFGPGALQGGAAGLVCAGAWVVAGALAGSPRGRDGALRAVAVGLAALAAVGAAAAILVWPATSLPLWTPRADALSRGIGGAVASALLAAPVGLGVVGLAARRLGDRARGAAVVASAVTHAGAVLAGLAWLGFLALAASGAAPAADGDPVVSALLALDAARSQLPLALRGGLAAAACLGALGLAVGAVDAISDAARAQLEDPPISGLAAALGALSVALALTGLAGPDGLGPALLGRALRWLTGWGLPAVALGWSLAVGWSRGMPELLRAADREGGLRVGRWLPVALRWVTPALLLVALLGQSAPLDPLPPARGGEGALGGVAHGLAPALVLLWLGVGSTLGLWLPQKAQESPC